MSANWLLSFLGELDLPYFDKYPRGLNEFTGGKMSFFKSVLLVVMVFLINSPVHADLIGTDWRGQPKISLEGEMLCSPDPLDQPRWRPHPYKTPYLQIERWSNGHFRIFESDNCSSWFGFDSVLYVFKQVGSEVYDYWTGEKVGTITANRIEIHGNGKGRTSIKALTLELQSDGSLRFHVKFTHAGKPGTFEQWGDYSPVQP